MNQIDCKQAQRVWSRVMASQADAQSETSAAGAPKPSAPDLQPAVITPEQVLRAMEHEHNAAAVYRCLAARMTGCAAATLAALAREEQCHVKKLAAMYFLLTGKKACLKKPEPPCITCNAEALRRQYQQELAAREHYEALAPLAGARACTLREIALDECRHAQKLYELLQSCL